MGFSKIDGTQEIFQTEVFDTFGRRVDKFKCNKKDFPSVVKILNDKWGLGMKVFTNDKKKDKSDLSWLR